MRSKMIKGLTAILVLCAIALCTVMFIPTARASTDPATLLNGIEFTMQKGAAVRYSDGSSATDNGISFLAQAPKQAIDDFENARTDGDKVEYGMVIAPKYYTDIKEFTQENLFGASSFYTWDGKTFGDGDNVESILRCGLTKSVSQDDANTYVFRGSVVDMKDVNLTTEYVAKAYIAYTDALGNTTYNLADYFGNDKANNSRSMTYVAQIAIDKQDDGYAWLQTNYVDKVTDASASYVVEHYVPAVGGGYTLKYSQTVTESVTIDDVATATPIVGGDFDGYYFDQTNANNVLSGKVYANGKLTLKVYYLDINAELDNSETNFANGKYISIWSSTANMGADENGVYATRVGTDPQTAPNLTLSKDFLALAEAKGYTGFTFKTVFKTTTGDDYTSGWWSIYKGTTKIGSDYQGLGVSHSFNFSDFKDGGNLLDLYIATANDNWNNAYVTEFKFINPYADLNDASANWASEDNIAVWSSTDANIVADSKGLKITSKSSAYASVNVSAELFKRAVAQGYTMFTIKGTQYDVSNDSERANWWTINVNSVEKYSSSASAKIDKTYNIDELLKNGDEYYDLVVGVGYIGGHYAYITSFTFSSIFDGLNDASTDWADTKYFSLWSSTCHMTDGGEYLQGQRYGADGWDEPTFTISNELLEKAEKAGYVSFTFTAQGINEAGTSAIARWWRVDKDDVECKAIYDETATGISLTVNLSELKNGDAFAKISICMFESEYNLGRLFTFTFNK